jgi:hypothetical protein
MRPATYIPLVEPGLVLEAERSEVRCLRLVVVEVKSDAQPPTVEISFLSLQTTHDPDIARNGNMGSKLAYFVLAWSFPTGLNGAFLSMVFRICDYWAYNQE